MSEEPRSLIEQANKLAFDAFMRRLTRPPETIRPQGERIEVPALPEPAPKHNGKLNEDGNHNVYPNNFGGIAIHANDGITWMEAKEALSLLAWLIQEQPTLERLAKESE